LAVIPLNPYLNTPAPQPAGGPQQPAGTLPPAQPGATPQQRAYAAAGAPAPQGPGQDHSKGLFWSGLSIPRVTPTYTPLPPPAPPQPLAKLDLHNLRNRFIEAPMFMVMGLVPGREVTLLPADGGTGKSQLMLQLAVCMALGRTFMGLHCVRTHVIYYSAEDESRVLLHRLRKIYDHMQLTDADMAALDARLHVVDMSDEPSLFCEVSDRAMGRMLMGTRNYDSLRTTVQALRGTGIERVSVIVDNASDTFDANENARQEVRKFIRLLKVVARQCDGACILLAHLDKASVRDPNGKAQFSGSTAWHNSVRSRLLLARSAQDSDELVLSQEKNNYGKGLTAPIRLRWNDAGVLVNVPREAGAAPLRLTKVELRDHVLSMIRERYEAGTYIGTSLANNSTTGVWAVLGSATGFPEQLQGADGKAQLHKLMRQAVEAKLVREEVYQNPTRRGHKDKRWQVATGAAPADEVTTGAPADSTGSEDDDAAE